MTSSDTSDSGTSGSARPLRHLRSVVEVPKVPHSAPSIQAHYDSDGGSNNGDTGNVSRRKYESGIDKHASVTKFERSHGAGNAKHFYRSGHQISSSSDEEEVGDRYSDHDLEDKGIKKMNDVRHRSSRKDEFDYQNSFNLERKRHVYTDLDKPGSDVENDYSDHLKRRKMDKSPNRLQVDDLQGMQRSGDVRHLEMQEKTYRNQRSGGTKQDQSNKISRDDERHRTTDSELGVTDRRDKKMRDEHKLQKTDENFDSTSKSRDLGGTDNIVESRNVRRSKDMSDEPGTPRNDSMEKKAKTIEEIFTKAGGAYIPPARLKQLQEGITDKTSIAYQRMSWEALKKSINGLINKVNVSNIAFIVQELMQENIVRGRGLVAQCVIRAQIQSPTFTNVYAALVAIVNTKFPKLGELVLKRCIIQFRRGFKRNDKTVCINSAKFIAHLVNQQVAHELLALEIITLLLQHPSDESVEVAISFLKEVGQKLTDVSPRGINAVFERLRNILHESSSSRRIQYMIEVMLAIRKDGFKDFPVIPEGLDLVEEQDQITHLLRLDENISGEDALNVFKLDPEYAENEAKYKEIKQGIFGSSDDDSSGDDEDDDEEDQEPGENGSQAEKIEIIDKTETNLVSLRRLIYLTIQSSLDFEECAHKMMKMNIKPGQEHEFCFMVLECCAQQRSFEKFFGLLAQRFCLLRKEFMAEYMSIFQEQYNSCHHLDTNKLRNTAKFFGHLLHTDAISWSVLECIKLNEDDTTSSSRIFIKILFQELAEYLGLPKLNGRLNDPVIFPYVEGVFPRDNPRDTRFSINFFTAIGLGGLTDGLREHLKTAPKKQALLQQAAAAIAESSSSSSSSDSDSSTDDSDSSSSTDSESEDEKRVSKKQEYADRARQSAREKKR